MEQSINIEVSDVIIVFLFFVFVGTIGYFVSTRKPSSEQLFFAGRKLTWPIIGFSILASNISTLTMLGLTTDAYIHGVSTSSYEWMASIILIVLALFIAPVYIKHKINTVPEYFGLRFGPIVRKYFSIISLFISSTVNICGPLFAGALLVNLFMPSISVWQAVIGIAIFSALYTSIGGLSAVVFTDFFQSILFILISLIISFSLFAQHQFDVASIITNIPEGHLKMIQPISDDYMPWLGLLFGVPILGFYFWCTDQVIVQRIIAARDLTQARYGLFFGAALKLTILFIIILPGVMAISIFPDLADPKDLYAIIIKELIPSGVIGLILSGLLAAMMSSIDSSLNSSATLIVYDFILPKNPNLSDKQVVQYGRLVVILMMIVSLLWTPIISRFEGIWIYAQTILTYLVPPLVTILFFGIFWRKGGEKDALSTLIFGHVLSLFIFIAQIMGWSNTHFTINAGILFVCSSLFYFVKVKFGPPTFSASSYTYGLLNPAYLRLGRYGILFIIGLLLATFISILPFL